MFPHPFGRRLRLALGELEQQRGDLFTDPLLGDCRWHPLQHYEPHLYLARITTVMPDGRTVSEWLPPHLEDADTSGKMPPRLPGATE